MTLTKVTASMTDFAPYNALDYGVDPTGVTNSTTAMKAFFDACIADEHPGNIPAGTYLITAGVLVFDNGHVDTPWPIITTDGYEAVIFKRADATDAAMIAITNGTATSAVGLFWQGGTLGGITFDQNGKATAVNQHGLLLRGMVGTQFGHMRADDQGGSCIYIESKRFGGTNPDPYNVGSCYFAAAEANRCGGASFWNDNYVGLTTCTIHYIRAIENDNGAFYGFGSTNRVDVMSVGSCKGWALGNTTTETANRFSLGAAEFDDVEYGIDIRRVANSDFGLVRFIHRYNFGPLNPAGGYWPRVCVQAGTVAAVAMFNFKIIDRIEAGGTKPDMGQFFDFANAGGNLDDVQIRRQILDNAGFGFSISDYYTNFNVNTTVSYTSVDGSPILDTLGKTAMIARAPTTFAVPNGGFGNVANVVQYNTEIFDPSLSYNPATYTYTCRSPGAYRVSARIVLAAAIGTRIRLGLYLNGAVDISRYFYATTANAQCYELNADVNVVAGTTLAVNADQNSGAAVNLTAFISANENQLFITQV